MAIKGIFNDKLKTEKEEVDLYLKLDLDGCDGSYRVRVVGKNGIGIHCGNLLFIDNRGRVTKAKRVNDKIGLDLDPYRMVKITNP